MARSDQDRAYRKASTLYANADLQGKHGNRCVLEQQDYTNLAGLPLSGPAFRADGF
jgi:hypothetical protein